MFIEVNGAKLYFDVEGAGLIPDGPSMRAKPTLILLHGGPGVDHTMYKPAFSALADIVQIVYFDQRGNGRSTGGGPETWNLAQWGDDVKGLCDALGIEKPIVYGGSFGGFVAQSYAIRYPDHPAKLVLASTAARVDFPTIFAAFERIGGPHARAVAEAYGSIPPPRAAPSTSRSASPSIVRDQAETPTCSKRSIVRNDVALRFNGPRNEQGRLDFRSALQRICCPVLILAGHRDPIMPMPFSETIAVSPPEPFGALGRALRGMRARCARRRSRARISRAT